MERRPGDDERVARVAGVANLTAIFVTSVTATRVPVAPLTPVLNVDLRAAGQHQLGENNELKVGIQFHYVTDPEAFSVVAVIALNYGLSAPVDDADAEAFARINAVFNAWPYWRELVQSTVVRMGFPSPHVPLLRV